jgi:5-methylcytosine-specific restriction endonuclease McrA
VKQTRLIATKPIPYRSKKMTKMYVDRRKLVANMLDDVLCVRCEVVTATEVHEVLTRARGGSILDESNCVPLCNSCHMFCTDYTKEALAEGFLKSRYSEKEDR